MKGRSNRKAAVHTPQDLATPPDGSAPVVHPSFPPDALPPQMPRLLTRPDAAAYCSVSLETFDGYRRRGIVPDPVDGTNRWDRKLIDIWLDRASGIVPDAASPLDEWRGQRNGENSFEGR